MDKKVRLGPRNFISTLINGINITTVFSRDVEFIFCGTPTPAYKI